MDANLLISPHFRRSEFSQPERYGCTAEAYPAELIGELTKLCRHVLEPVRAKAPLVYPGAVVPAAPVHVLSGWRSKAYNEALYDATGKPPTDSQHSYGRAADIVIPGLAAGLLHQMILEMWRAQELPELGGLGLYVGFVHVDTWIAHTGHLRQWAGSRTREQTS